METRPYQGSMPAPDVAAARRVGITFVHVSGGTLEQKLTLARRFTESATHLKTGLAQLPTWPTTA